MAQKFQKVIPKVPWPREVTEGKIKSVWEEIGEFNRIINAIDRQMFGLLEQKMIIKIKIGNKTKYANQLRHQLEEPDLLNSDQNAQVSDTTKADSSNEDGTIKATDQTNNTDKKEKRKMNKCGYCSGELKITDIDEDHKECINCGAKYWWRDDENVWRSQKGRNRKGGA